MAETQSESDKLQALDPKAALSTNTSSGFHYELRICFTNMKLTDNDSYGVQIAKAADILSIVCVCYDHTVLHERKENVNVIIL